MKPTPKPKTVARRGWSAKCGALYARKKDANADARLGGLDKGYPVALLDLRPEAVERYVERVANALCCEHMGALPGAYSLTPEKDCAKGSESAYMWRSARAAVSALLRLSERKARK